MADMKQLTDIIDGIIELNKTIESYTQELKSANRELEIYSAKDKNDTMLYLQHIATHIRNIDPDWMLVEFHMLVRMMPKNLSTLVPSDTKYHNTWERFLSSMSKSDNYVTVYCVGFIRELISAVENADSLVYSETV